MEEAYEEDWVEDDSIDDELKKISTYKVESTVAPPPPTTMSRFILPPPPPAGGDT